jgi:dTDP-4-amino-4,6-dideoxygalactose transaminase
MVRRDRPLIGFSYRTVGLDDVMIARKLSRQLDNWDDPAPVHEYEYAFSKLVAGASTTAWASARVALTAAITALDLPPGSDVLVPGYTCVAVANAVRFAGHVPVFADIELDTYGPSLDSVRQRITPRTRAVVVQHLYGLVARDYVAIAALCADRGIRLVEDCAQATAARHDGRPVGLRGDVAVFSSEQSKLVCTVQGGVAVARDVTVAARLAELWADASPSGRAFTQQLLANVSLGYFEKTHPLREFTGPFARRRWGGRRLVSTTPQEESGVRPTHYGRRMSAPVAALGLNQLSKLDDQLVIRRRRATEWNTWAASRGFDAPTIIAGSEPVFLRYPVLVPAAMKRDTSWGATLGVEVGVWFRTQLHPAPGTIPSCPNAMYAVEHCVNLPTL